MPMSAKTNLLMKASFQRRTVFTAARIFMYLENCIQRKSIDDKNILYIKTSEVMLLTNINDDSIESFEENEVKKLA